MSTMLPTTTDWICKVQHALEGHDDDCAPEFFIRKVPGLYKASSKHFEPMGWRFGLHNRRVLDIGGTESVKIRVAKKLGLTRTQWTEFCESVVPDPKSLQLMYYDGTNCSQPPYTLEEIRWLLTLDTLCIVATLQYSRYMTLPVVVDRFVPSFSHLFYRDAGMDMAMLFRDMFLLENQVPFQLLKRVIEKLREITLCDSEDMKLPEWDTSFWHTTMIAFNLQATQCVALRELDSPSWIEHVEKLRVGISTNDIFNKFHHNMDVMHYIWCGSQDTIPAISKRYVRIPSATALHIAGVTIKGKCPAFLGDIAFENGCLMIPFIEVYDSTEVLLRNLVIYEDLYLTVPIANTYTTIMDDLVKTEDDFNLLVNSGVFVHNLDDDEIGAHRIWKRIKNQTYLPWVSEELHTTLKSLNKFAKSKRNLYWYEFKRTFCSRPWLVLSVLTISLVTIATCIQAYTAVIGSNGMKPQFPH